MKPISQGILIAKKQESAQGEGGNEELLISSLVTSREIIITKIQCYKLSD
jgi:hypothetical protein